MKVLLAIASLALAPAAFAQLQFDQDTVEVKADAGAGTITAKYPFKVKGTEKITIFGTETDCGCTAATLDKQIYRAGESGEITINFSAGDRIGPQMKKIRVKASDQGEPHVLTFKTDIPVFARVIPQFVAWESKETPTPKVVTFELPEGNAPIASLTATSNHPGAKTEVRELVKGRRYEVTITPTTTETFFLATVQLAAGMPDGKPARTLLAYATVKPPLPPTPQEAARNAALGNAPTQTQAQAPLEKK